MEDTGGEEAKRLDSSRLWGCPLVSRRGIKTGVEEARLNARELESASELEPKD